MDPKAVSAKYRTDPNYVTGSILKLFSMTHSVLGFQKGSIFGNPLVGCSFLTALCL
jgi:hypothetical protein